MRTALWTVVSFTIALLIVTANTPVVAESVSQPIILTIDGIDWKMSPFVKAGFGLSADSRASSYLKPAIVSTWEFATKTNTQHIPWSGDFGNMESEIDNIKTFINGWLELARNRDVPLVIVSHSWGSVLAYRAIYELGQEGGIGNDSIDQFITLGSPLESHWDEVKAISRRHGRWRGIGAVSRYIREWHNYWIQEDLISGPILELDRNNQLLDSEHASIVAAHADYYQDAKLLDFIGQHTRRSLGVEESTARPPQYDVDCCEGLTYYKIIFTLENDATGDSRLPNSYTGTFTIDPNNIELLGDKSTPSADRRVAATDFVVEIGGIVFDRPAPNRIIALTSKDMGDWELVALIVPSKDYEGPRIRIFLTPDHRWHAMGERLPDGRRAIGTYSLVNCGASPCEGG